MLAASVDQGGLSALGMHVTSGNDAREASSAGFNGSARTGLWASLMLDAPASISPRISALSANFLVSLEAGGRG